MEEAQVSALLGDLSSPDERVRLKAANACVTAGSGLARAAIPVLRQVYFKDPNPAVKFLVKKALGNLGEVLEKGPGPQDVPVAAKVDAFAVLPDGKILQKVALDLLKDEVRALLALLSTNDPHLQDQLAFALEQLGSGTCAGPLIQAIVKDQSVKVSTGDTEASELGSAPDVADLQAVMSAARLKSSGINPAMAALMGNLLVPEVFEILVGALLSEKPVLARGTVAVLAELEDQALILPLVAALGAGLPVLDLPIREKLASLAKEHPSFKEAIVRTLVGKLDPRREARSRIESVKLLGMIADPAALDALRELIERGDPELRTEVAFSLARYDFPSAWLVSNLRPLLSDADPRPAAAAAATILASEDFGPARDVLGKLVAGEAKARSAAAAALARIDRPAVLPYLEGLLHDPDASVKAAALAGVRRLESPEGIALLSGLLTDEDQDVAAAAIEKAGRLKQDQFNDLLVLLCDQATSPRLLATLLMALGRMGLPENVPTVAYYLNADDARVRANAIEALELINDPKAMSLVHLSLSDPDPRVRANAVKALWGWGEVKIGKVAGNLLGGPPREAASACHALGEMVGRTRRERELVERPMLVAALRQAPRYAELRRAASS